MTKVSTIAAAPTAAGPNMSEVAVKALVRVFAAWKIGADAPPKLAGVSDRTWGRMKKGDRGNDLSQDEMTRASALIGLYKGLHIYFTGDLADEWISLPNRGPLFQGRSPVDYMIEGGIPAIYATRRYIDAIRGGL